MQYAQLNQDGSYSHQITTSGNLEWDSDHVCPAAALTPEEALLFRVVPLRETESPTIDQMAQTAIRDGGERVEGHWQYKWRVDTLTPEQVEDKRKNLVPQAVSMRQAELALLDAGLLDDIEALIPTLPRADQISWKRATTVERSNPLVAYVQQANNLTDAQIDDLFTEAAKL